MSNDNQQWAANYTKISETPPAEGTILRAQDDAPVKLTVELKDGASPFIFGRAFVPDLFGTELGWYLQGADSKSYHGWKCVLLPNARTKLIKRVGLGTEIDGEIIILVKSLKVIRQSHSGHSLLCEVHEYLEDEVPPPIDGEFEDADYNGAVPAVPE
jgi:hypothetical protein